MPQYIRNTRTMKAAPVTDEDAFRKANPDGKFVYFDVEETPSPDPKPEPSGAPEAQSTKTKKT